MSLLTVLDSERLFQQQTDLHSCLVKEYESYETSKKLAFDCLWILDFRYLEARNSTMVALYNVCASSYVTRK